MFLQANGIKNFGNEKLKKVFCLKKGVNKRNNVDFDFLGTIKLFKKFLTLGKYLEN